MNYSVSNETIKNIPSYKKVGIIGLGFVGGAILKSFKLKNIDVIGYDKYKNENTSTFDSMLETNIVFLCLPTLFNEEIQSYDKSSIYETCSKLSENNYNGIVVIKSTVEPESTNKLLEKYNNLNLIHHPEFLTARTAFEDFHNMTHAVIGCSRDLSQGKELVDFYSLYYPTAYISICMSVESESMKIFCNSFYASKIMLFNEYYLLCQKNNSNFNTIKDLMLKNNWINPMHTNIPGPDRLLGYGGACFPKDTKALLNYMKDNNTHSSVLESVINSCDNIRKQ